MPAAIIHVMRDMFAPDLRIVVIAQIPARYSLVNVVAADAELEQGKDEPRGAGEAQRRAQEVQPLDCRRIEVIAVDVRQQDKAEPLVIRLKRGEGDAAINEYLLVDCDGVSC